MYKIQIMKKIISTLTLGISVFAFSQIGLGGIQTQNNWTFGGYAGLGTGSGGTSIYVTPKVGYKVSENKICKLLNKTPQVIMDATEVAQYNLKSATIIEEKETNHAEISSNNNEDSDSETMKKLLELVKKKGGIEKFEKFLEQ